MTDASLVDLLACPRCDRHPLASGEGGWRCPACKTGFGALRGLPWLFAEPAAARGEWRNRLHLELSRLARDAQSLREELAAGTLRPLTRQRLEKLLTATEAQRRALVELLAPLDVTPDDAVLESHLALRTRLPLDQGLNTYYANVHRDWCWGEAENAAALAEIRAFVPQAAGDVLVPGAGAGRLAFDLHHALGPARTVAVDFNPLLALVAATVTRGDALELYEFPIAPRTLEDVAVARRLAAPHPARDGFHLVLADVLRPPFRPGAFDLVVTPWLIDIVTEDFPVFAARINRLLKTGGRWVNSGSLAFDAPERARRYGPEEVLAILEETGFGEAATSESVLPYMCSPASRHGRREQVFTFAAVKTGEAPAPSRHKALPDWLVTGKEPVPLLADFRTQAMTTRIYAFLMSLIDGRRTIEDMAALMEKEKLMPRADAVPAIRRFLTRMYDDSRRGTGLLP
ncbi:MAG TPA: class I SAM-dependent methyltransferase [Woeseiaceae bacterium]|nr:class I SAM-dependent methyltransferase [Woeseiaceae bacterium]